MGVQSVTSANPCYYPLGGIHSGKQVHGLEHGNSRDAASCSRAP